MSTKLSYVLTFGIFYSISSIFFRDDLLRIQINILNYFSIPQIICLQDSNDSDDNSIINKRYGKKGSSTNVKYDNKSQVSKMFTDYFEYIFLIYFFSLQENQMEKHLIMTTFHDLRI